jgi:hypothetical protein
MATLQEQILAAALLVLKDCPGVVLAERSRRVGVDREDQPALILRPDEDQYERFGGGADKHTFDALVLVHTRGDPWDVVADPFKAWVHQHLMTDARVRGLVTDVRGISATPEDTEADATAGVYTLRFRFTYLARADRLDATP